MEKIKSLSHGLWKVCKLAAPFLVALVLGFQIYLTIQHEILLRDLKANFGRYVVEAVSTAIQASNKQ